MLELLDVSPGKLLKRGTWKCTSFSVKKGYLKSAWIIEWQYKLNCKIISVFK